MSYTQLSIHDVASATLEHEFFQATAEREGFWVSRVLFIDENGDEVKITLFPSDGPISITEIKKEVAA